MNCSNTIFPEIGNRNKTYNDLENDSTASLSSSISETAQQKHPSFIPESTNFGSENNDIHNNKYHRNVESQETKAYLTQQDFSRVPFHENTDNTTENLSESRKWPSCTETVKSFFTSLIPARNGEEGKAFYWDPKPKSIATSILGLYHPCLGVMGNIGIGIFAFLSTVSVSGASRKANDTHPIDKEELGNIATNNKDLMNKEMPTKHTIAINNSEMLEKIGVHKDFSSDGNYELTDNIDASNFTTSIKEFSGDFNGRYYTISNLRYCMIGTMIDGTLRNLIISKADIHENKKCLSVIFCIVEGYSKISYLQITDSMIDGKNALPYNAAGMVAVILGGMSKIENTLVKNCSIKTSSNAAWSGCLAGVAMLSSESRNNTIDKCQVITNSDDSDSGCLFGVMLGNNLSSDDTVSNCTSTTKGKNSHSGCAVGYVNTNGAIRNVIVSDSEAKSMGGGDTGIVLGSSSSTANGTISESVAINSKAIATNEGSTAGIWVGGSSKNIHLDDNISINCTVEFPSPRETTTTASVTTANVTTASVTTASVTTANVTTASVTTANVTTIEPAMVNGVSYLPAGLLLAGATVASISIGVTACCAYSLYNGYKEGKRGGALATHPFLSFGQWVMNCRRPSGFQSLREEQTEAEWLSMEPMGTEGARESLDDEERLSC